jgi:hypothetical protein
MKLPGTSAAVGPLGLALVIVTAAAGIVLAVHGWSGRHAGQPPGALAGPGPGPAARTSPALRPAASPATSAAGPRPRTASPAASPGPLLSSQQYAAYSFRVWPGTPGADARAALTGLSVTVRRHGSGILVTARVNGQPGGAPRLYANGALVYVVEASLGDDSGATDYSLGDDGLVVTDTQGRIVQ